jgi:putative heme-binding domain-containing protein
VETTDGQTFIGTLRNDSADGLSIADLSGQETAIARGKVLTQIQLKTSLMPEGLEETITRQQLLDLVAWLSTLKRSR